MNLLVRDKILIKHGMWFLFYFCSSFFWAIKKVDFFTVVPVFCGNQVNPAVWVIYAYTTYCRLKFQASIAWAYISKYIVSTLLFSYLESWCWLMSMNPSTSSWQPEPFELEIVNLKLDVELKKSSAAFLMFKNCTLHLVNGVERLAYLLFI